MHANLLDDTNLLIKGYSLINIYIFNVLMEWMFFEMYCQVHRKMTMVVTIFEELLMVVSKSKWN